MTSTPVKDVGSVLSSLTGAAGNSAKTAAGQGFQTVLNGQTGREAAKNRMGNAKADKAKTAAQKTPGESLKAKDAHRARVSDRKPAESAEAKQEETGIPAERLEEIMEMLGTAAADLMQQIADAFGITLEELEGAMQELGMESLDVLDQGKLGALLLKIGGEQDAYALVTNGELYENYQNLMAELENLLQEVGAELDVTSEQLQAALQSKAAEEITAEEIPAETVQEPAVEVLVETTENEAVENQELGESAQAQQTVTETVEKQQPDESEQQSDSDTGRRQGDEPVRSGRHHVFAQNYQVGQFQSQYGAQVQQTEAASDPWSAQTRDIMRQIMDYMRIQVRPDTSSLEMQLHPESLGTLHIQVASKGGMLTANFIAQNETVKAALESQMVQLRESFEQQGVKVEAIEVTVQSHAFERNLDQGRGQSSTQEQNQAARRTRTRRINLNDSLETENLEEEDALAAEMMAASGSQVDYTV